MNNSPSSKETTKRASFFANIIGRINWISPPWLTYLRNKAITRPALFWGILTSLLLILFTVGYSYHWYKNLPQPKLVTALITIPQITPIAEEMVPNPLVIDFGYTTDNFTAQSVAPLQNINKEVTDGVEIIPGIEGTWLWESDSRLVFTPSTDWPAGQQYTVKFAKHFFASNVKMDTLTPSFSTKPFQAVISEFKFYQDPLNAKLRQAVSTIAFNFPVDAQSVENNISLMLQAFNDGKLDLNAEHFKFTVKYDEHKRTAYLRSEPLAITDVPRYLVLTLNKGIQSATHSSDIPLAVKSQLLIPDSSSYFKVDKAAALIIRNEQDRPEQLLTIETTLGITESQLNKALHVYVLPANYPATNNEGEKINYDWQNPGEVSSLILAQSTSLALNTMPTDRNFSTLHSFKFTANTPAYLYLKIDKGTQGFGGFKLTNDYVAIIKVPELPKEIRFLHKGALLALSSEKKLSVLVRGLPAVKFQLARVLPNNINQLVTQTQGDFNNPYFINQSFNQQNISELFSEIQQFDNSDLTKQHYTAINLENYLSMPSNTEGTHGLFLLQATGWDVTTNAPLDVKASRLVLITDAGLLVKDNNDGSHDVFVQSIIAGTPIINSSVSILGKNGLPILTRVTDAQGRANFPALNDFVEDREPTVYVVSTGSDLSFIPYSNYSRQLNFSRFDTGGLYSNNQESGNLSAFIFSDRGIYRPGDMAHIGVIVKQAYAKPQPAGLPLQAMITDPRGTTVYDQLITLDSTGYLSIDFKTNPTSPTGQYLVNLYTVKDKHTENLLGSTSLRVAEFQPDRMRITSQYSQKTDGGWVSPNDLSVNVSLWNLYGAPAENRRVSGKIVLTPLAIHFDKYPEYTFIDPLLDPTKPVKTVTETLTDTTTNEQGEAHFTLDLDKFDKATYQLAFYSEGFEAEGGRSVATQSVTLVSPLTYFVGFKPDGNLSYIKQNSQRQVNLIAVTPQLKQQAVSHLTIQVLSLHPVTTLVKKDDGTYQYQSIIQISVIGSNPFSIEENGSNITLPTDKIGDFAISIRDQNDQELNRFKYSVVGVSQAPLSKNAELSIKLNQSEYKAGDTIEIQIVAPYTGAGLITIERDKVYSTQWFKTDSTSSVQTIRIPDDFQGNGYVNVAFIRGWDSPEIFMSPLSYSILPFKISNENHAVHITLDTPTLARPGEDFTINYSSDKPGKIIVFAVDEGILQVAKHLTPDPLAFFFQKHALEVATQQTVDQILPDYIKDREISSIGGDGGEELLANHLNPFKRKTDLPVVYWSGIIDTDVSVRKLTYQMPDYFNGALRVMAVAVTEDAVGSTEKQSEVRGNFIINPNIPTFVAPGDEFEITASVANNVKNSGEKANVVLKLDASAELEVISSSAVTIPISEGHEQTVHFKLRAKQSLGSAAVTLIANLGDKFSSMKTSLSIRPASTFMTSVNSGFTQDKSKTLSIDRNLYPNYRHVDVLASSSPLILVAGLDRYLQNFPYGCTEQLVSKAMPLLAMSNQPWFINDAAAVTEKITTTMQLLGQRQMSSGAFSYWPGAGDNVNNIDATLYASLFLTDAKGAGYVVPNNLFYATISYLKELSAQTPVSLESARNQAYAIYLLTRNEVVTTNYLTNLQVYLEQNQANIWKEDIISAYIASTYQLLKSSEDAERLIGYYKPQSKAIIATDFYNQPIADAQYLYLIAQHFPNRLTALNKSLLIPLVDAMNSDEINTVFSGYTTLALAAYTHAIPAITPGKIEISEILSTNQQKTLVPSDAAFAKVSIGEDVKQIRLMNFDKTPYFYQLTQAGFDNKAPISVVKEGMEIVREYRSTSNDVITSTSLGSEIEVHIQLRSLENPYLSNIAIVDLLPGGFEVVTDSVETVGLDYIDVREDRVVFFTGLSTEAKEIVYRIKATNTGTFIVPAIYAESMYNPKLKARGMTGQMVVTD